MEKSRLIAGALLAVTCAMTGVRPAPETASRARSENFARVAALKEETR